MTKRNKIICSKCKKPLESSRINKQSYCKDCHAEHMRLNRPKHSDLTRLQRRKANCRSYLNVYIKRGKVIKGLCAVCNSKNTEAHHSDYGKPLDVIWLCREHHLEHHIIRANADTLI